MTITDPAGEDVIKGNWYAVICQEGKKKTLITEVLRYFFDDKDWKELTHVLFDCLKPHVGISNVVDGFPVGSCK